MAHRSAVENKMVLILRKENTVNKGIYPVEGFKPGLAEMGIAIGIHQQTIGFFSCQNAIYPVGIVFSIWQAAQEPLEPFPGKMAIQLDTDIPT